MKAKKAAYVYRSAVTGKLVTELFALQNPNTTVKELVKKAPKAKKRRAPRSVIS